MFLTKKKKNKIAKSLAFVQTVLNQSFIGETDKDAIDCWDLAIQQLIGIADEIGGIKLMELTKYWYDNLAERIEYHGTK